MNVRRAVLGLLLLGGALAAAPASAGGKEEPPPLVAFVAPGEGPDAPLVEEVRAGLVCGLGSAGAGADGAATAPTLRDFPFPAPGKTADLAAAWKKTPPDVIVAWCPDGRTREIEAFAEKAKTALVVVSPEETRQSLDVARSVFWAGGIRTPDEALQAMDFLLLPCGSHRPAILHDGGARGADAAARCLVLHHVSQDPIAPAALGDDFAGEAAANRVAEIVAGGADGIVYFGGAAGASRLLDACIAADVKVPVVLGQGLASRAVPAFAEGRAKTAWALETAFFGDYDKVPDGDRATLDAHIAPAKLPLTSGVVRGFRIGGHVRTALAASGGDAKKLGPAFRALNYEAARKKAVFDSTGHANLVRFVPWRSPAEPKEPAFRRVRPTLMPMSGIPQVGTFHPSKFKWQPGTTHVWCTWGEGAERTIEKDLQAIGLATGGYESELESQILDDLMGRFISRMNRLYRRNPDGTEIPGISWNVSFTTDPPGKDVKAAKKFRILLAGDDPMTGGRAAGTQAWIYTTFLQRTLYADHALTPPIAASDRAYLSGRYKWGTSVDENIRCDRVRALVDGYTQAMALTGAHEVGHICGPDHDTESPRSIMNVVDAVGLEFEWADWIPAHEKMLDRALGRAAASKD